jgi:DNA-binding transcriptional LysR family regulator
MDGSHYKSLGTLSGSARRGSVAAGGSAMLATGGAAQPLLQRSVDLNLFRLFEALDRLRSVSAASRELGVTPSAGSHGLARLRSLLDDQLFIPGQEGLLPTPRAVALARIVPMALQTLVGALEGGCFDPSVPETDITLATSDYGAMVILPVLAKRLEEVAPGVRLNVRYAEPAEAVRLVEQGAVHMSLVVADGTSTTICRKTLLTDQKTVLVRDGHPLATTPFTAEHLPRYRCVLAELHDAAQEGGIVTKLGRMTAAMTVPRSWDAVAVVRSTDLMAVLPQRVAMAAAQTGGLRLLDMMDESYTVQVDMVWHERVSSDPAVRWLRSQMDAILPQIIG